MSVSCIRAHAFELFLPLVHIIIRAVVSEGSHARLIAFFRGLLLPFFHGEIIDEHDGKRQDEQNFEDKYACVVRSVKPLTLHLLN